MAETTDRAKGKNLICFGAPGTGKSHSMTEQMKKIYDDNEVPNPANLLELPEEAGIRTTFHPDSDYSTFVGCYKPRTTANHQIEYHFQPQAFVNAYVNAWCTNKPYFLVIEEINRGNCAQIFGDLFQVLDRKPDGEHEYSIKPDADLRDCIKEEFKNKKIPEDCVIPRDIKEGKILYLPKNLTLLATMNTSDQSLFPMDSAFKRRWEWCYMPITAGKKARKIEIIKETFYSWWEFIQKVNERIYKVTKSEDKKIGYWFVKVNDNARETISADLFVNKVLFYLWSDVFKDYGEATGSPFALKNGEKTKFVTYQQLFNDNGTLNTDDISQMLGENGLELTKLSKGDECKDDPYEKDNEEKQSENAIDEGKTDNSPDDKVEPEEVVESIVYDSLPSGEGPGWSVATSFVDKKAYEGYTVEQLKKDVDSLAPGNKEDYRKNHATITFLNKKSKDGNLLQFTDTEAFRHLVYFVLSVIDISALNLSQAGVDILRPGETKKEADKNRYLYLREKDETKYGFNKNNNEVISLLKKILEQLLEKKQYKDLFVISNPIKR